MKDSVRRGVNVCHTDICQNSGTGTRARVAQVRAEYPNQLDYTGAGTNFTGVSMMSKKKKKPQIEEILIWMKPSETPE